MNAPDRGRPGDRIALLFALFALAALYALWYHDDEDRVAALLVFALPPLLLGLGVLARRVTARFWAGVCALLWFSHGVMTAWAHAEQRGFALIEILLAVVVVIASSAPGLRARFGRGRSQG
jgi:prepilin-type N-terminal cleavage/methylation domain-containing protein